MILIPNNSTTKYFKTFQGAWIKSQGFFGAMVWHISGDDVQGRCGDKQLLLKQLHHSIH